MSPSFSPPWDQQVAPVRVPEPHGTRWAARRRPTSAFQVPVPVVAAWSPTTPGDLKAWWDASDTSAITASSNKVGQWNDESGNSFNMVQATSAKQPLTNTNTRNGHNVLKYEINQLEQMASSGSMGLVPPFTLHVVTALATTDTNAGIIFYTGNNGIQLTLKNTTNFPFEVFDGWNAVTVCLGANYDTNIHIHSIVVGAGSGSNAVTYYMDGTSVGTGTTGAAALPTSNSSLAGFQFYAGDFCEAWIGTTAQSSTVIASAHGYAQSKWGVA